MEKLEKSWLLQHLERFAIFVCTTSIMLGSFLLWENYQFTQTATNILEELKRNDARQDMEIAEMKGRMVGWDTLKRIELFLSTHPVNERGAMLGEAIKMEVETRGDKSANRR